MRRLLSAELLGIVAVLAAILVTSTHAQKRSASAEPLASNDTMQAAMAQMPFVAPLFVEDGGLQAR